MKLISKLKSLFSYLCVLSLLTSMIPTEVVATTYQSTQFISGNSLEVVEDLKGYLDSKSGYAKPTVEQIHGFLNAHSFSDVLLVDYTTSHPGNPGEVRIIGIQNTISSYSLNLFTGEIVWSAVANGETVVPRTLFLFSGNGKMYMGPYDSALRKDDVNPNQYYMSGSRGAVRVKKLSYTKPPSYSNKQYAKTATHVPMDDLFLKMNGKSVEGATWSPTQAEIDSRITTRFADVNAHVYILKYIDSSNRKVFSIYDVRTENVAGTSTPPPSDITSKLISYHDYTPTKGYHVSTYTHHPYGWSRYFKHETLGATGGTVPSYQVLDISGLKEPNSYIFYEYNRDGTTTLIDSKSPMSLSYKNSSGVETRSDFYGARGYKVINGYAESNNRYSYVVQSPYFKTLEIINTSTPIDTNTLVKIADTTGKYHLAYKVAGATSLYDRLYYDPAGYGNQFMNWDHQVAPLLIGGQYYISLNPKNTPVTGVTYTEANISTLEVSELYVPALGYSSIVTIDPYENLQMDKNGWITGIEDPTAVGAKNNNEWYVEEFKDVLWDIETPSPLYVNYIHPDNTDSVKVKASVSSLPSYVTSPTQLNLVVRDDMGRYIRIPVDEKSAVLDGKYTFVGSINIMNETKYIKYFLEYQGALVSSYAKVAQLKITREARPQLNFTNVPATGISGDIVRVRGDLNVLQVALKNTIEGRKYHVLATSVDGNVQKQYVYANGKWYEGGFLDYLMNEFLPDNNPTIKLADFLGDVGKAKKFRVELFVENSAQPVDAKEIVVDNLQNNVAHGFKVELDISYKSPWDVDKNSALPIDIYLNYIYYSPIPLKAPLQDDVTITVSAYNNISSDGSDPTDYITIDTLQLNKIPYEVESGKYHFKYSMPTESIKDKTSYTFVWTFKDGKGNTIMESTQLDTRYTQPEIKNPITDRLNNNGGLFALLEKYWIFLLIGLVVFILIKRR